jgi:hypothetical protein
MCGRPWEAVLAGSRTRAMYLRRLRTLMDRFLATDYIDNLAMVGPVTSRVARYIASDRKAKLTVVL